MQGHRERAHGEYHRRAGSNEIARNAHWHVIDATTLYPGLNSNVSEWFVTGIYVGTGMEGSTTAALRIGSVNVVT